MSSPVAVRSIDSLKDLRVSLALFGEEALGALGAVGAELRRTAYWLQQDRPAFWQEQIKRRREEVSSAKAELFRRQLAKAPGSSLSDTDQVEKVRRAEANLQEAERRLILTRKWQVQLNQAVLEYHGSVRRIKTLAASDVPSAVNLLNRLVDALEAYLQETAPSTTNVVSSTAPAPPAFATIATKMIEEAPPPPPDDATVEGEEDLPGDLPPEE